MPQNNKLAVGALFFFDIGSSLLSLRLQIYRNNPNIIPGLFDIFNQILEESYSGRVLYSEGVLC